MASTLSISRGSKMGKLKKAGLRPIVRFRALVRVIMANVHWMKEDTIKKETKSKFSIELSTQDKLMMMKPVEMRTAEEKHRLHLQMRKTKIFRRYPEEVQEQLAGSIHFLFYGPGRTIVRQGHAAHSMYFILSGEVDIYIKYHDAVTDKYKDMLTGKMVRGEMFGEIALLQNLDRNATVVTATNCELLYLKKEHFVEILKTTLQEQWDERKVSMERLQYFSCFNSEQIRECCIVSKIKHFNENTILMNENLKQFNVNSLFFIVNGTCSVIYKLDVLVTKDIPKSYRLFLPNIRPKENEQKETFFLQVGLLKEKGVFGFNEDMKDKSIVSLTNGKLLVIPHFWIHSNNTKNIWDKTFFTMNMWSPTKNEAFEWFVSNRKWLRYRQKLTKPLIKRKLNTTVHDIPYSLRLKFNVNSEKEGYI